jgi:hypothetical protein
MMDTTKHPAVEHRLNATASRQRVIDAFYAQHGPCCAGCDWWRHYNAVVGECIKAPPVSGSERVAMLGVQAPSVTPGAGHVMTRRDHHCGEFRDSGPDAYRNGNRSAALGARQEK